MMSVCVHTMHVWMIERRRTILVGGNLFVVLHETREAEVGPVLCVRHLLQASQGGVGFCTVQPVQTTGQSSHRGAPSVPQTAS